MPIRIRYPITERSEWFVEETRHSRRRMTWLLPSHPTPPISKSLVLSLLACRRSRLLPGDGMGVEPNRREKAWSSMNHSIPYSLSEKSKVWPNLPDYQYDSMMGKTLKAKTAKLKIYHILNGSMYENFVLSFDCLMPLFLYIYFS